MDNFESYSDMFVNAVKYGISNKRVILAWGAIGLVAYIIFFIGYITVLLNFRSIWALVIFALAAIPIIVIGVLSIGYMCRCLRGLLGGNNTAPGLSEPVELVVDSIKMLFIYLEAIIGIAIVFIPMLLVLLTMKTGSSGTILICLLYPIELALSISIVSLNVIQWAVFADTGSLLKGLNPITPIRLVLADLKNSVMIAVLAFILYLSYSIIVGICTALVCTFVIVPFTLIPFYCAGMYLLARFYRRATGKGIETPPQPTV